MVGPPPLPAPSPLAGAADVQPVVILQPDGSPVEMVQPSDLPPLAQDATLQLVATEATLEALESAVAKDATSQSILSAVLRQPEASTKATQVTVSLVAPVVDQAVDLTGYEKVQRVKVKDLSGTTATLKFGPAGAAPLDLAAGDDFPALGVTALTLNSPGGAGGTITLQIFGSTPPSQ